MADVSFFASECCVQDVNMFSEIHWNARAECNMKGRRWQLNMTVWIAGPVHVPFMTTTTMTIRHKEIITIPKLAITKIWPFHAKFNYRDNTALWLSSKGFGSCTLWLWIAPGEPLLRKHTGPVTWALPIGCLRFLLECTSERADSSVLLWKMMSPCRAETRAPLVPSVNKWSTGHDATWLWSS